MAFDEYYAFRRSLIEALEKDLLGPTSPDEVIEDPPITHYLTGILYPQGERGAGDQDESEADVDSENGDAPDPPVALANVRYPSSVGITFAVDGSFDGKLIIGSTAGRYEYSESVNDPVSADPNDSKTSADRRPSGTWVRHPVEGKAITIDVGAPRSTREEVADGLAVFYRIRPTAADGTIPITVVLLNTRRALPGQLRDSRAFFQPCLTVNAIDQSSPFVERRLSLPQLGDDDLRSYELLYRHAHAFAVGHGCSAAWEEDEERPERASEIRTTFTPECAVRVAESNPDINAEKLTMNHLSYGSDEGVIGALAELCSGYRAWIEEQSKAVDSKLSAPLAKTASDHLSLCREAVERMERGLGLLRSDEFAMTAFRLANQAMLQQRARTEWLKAGVSAESVSPDTTQPHAWRPFQIAFVLLCLEGIARPESSDRQLADLLWFPTGGGKTEAYLGLIAFTIFHRRLRLDGAGGVTALMRYTLRLLTIQQFERAALLVCCCEAIRLSRSDLGKDEISIGLWVGEGATPNTRSDARTALDQLRRGVELEKGNPLQIHACSWCGSPLSANNYFIADKTARPRLIVKCGRPECAFGKGLPVFLVDEDVYEYQPTLLIATVDKFASLPWKEDRAALFNLGDGTPRHPSHRRPDLIIQDELHLISGPLGTLAGLYETAIDALCTQDGIPPKVIASTATIRRAGPQARALFNRDVRQFPPSAIDARYSYFSTEAPSERRGDRMYVGLMAPGMSHTTLLVRAYAALLQNAETIAAPAPIKDPYWTLVGYFNSLRVLGGARMQVQDDVSDRIGLLASRADGARRSSDFMIELTSRESSSKIPSHLKDMAKALPSSDVLDVILATNMISVGVDIDRLGLMVMMGQPQSTSEYIQATSRVGRQFPGLVVVLFNSTRSRDRSHYESFLTYHSALYRQVESSSVTPFSARARDRGLHAVLIGLARLLLPRFRPNAGAREIVTHRQDLEEVSQLILQRVAATAPEEVDGTREQLKAILDVWEARANDGSDFFYSRQMDPNRSLLVSAEGEPAEEDGPFPTPWSLRDVDRASTLYRI